MGTAMRSGQNRAVEAAMAAMASPLLEAGAIDGARGILINITGSSSLKLSEVNEASTIIQNAAHEDANIIFGAVQDETMGDEVKITVIATGFKQQEMPQRRERMLAEATLPTMRYDVPIAPRVTNARAAAPRFASETVPEPVAEAAPSVEAKEIAPAADSRTTEVKASPELVPVAASVFDDDFFKSHALREEAIETIMPERYREPAHIGVASHVHQEDLRSATAEQRSVAEPSGRAQVFGTTVAVSADHAEPDELDIPAFLRRGN
jgi:cell division protein FtsZ